jgi:hypothetical protein
VRSATEQCRTVGNTATAVQHFNGKQHPQNGLLNQSVTHHVLTTCQLGQTTGWLILSKTVTGPTRTYSLFILYNK